MTLVLEVDQHFPQPGVVEHAVEELQKTGGLIVFPTDTIYGVGCDITHINAIEKLNSLKGDRNGKNYSILVKDFKQLREYAVITKSQENILKEHLPGPFTFVLKASKKVPKYLISNQGTVGIRIPRNRLCKALITKLKKPLIGTSLNKSREDIVTNPEKIPKKLLKYLDVVLDANVLGATSSTVVDLTTKQPVILRQGVGKLRK